MTALDLLPQDTRDAIANGKPIRDDLRVIPAAEAAGWKVSFRDDNWHNAADFYRGLTVVWLATSRGLHWRRREGRRPNPIDLFPHTMEGLRAALSL
jgi:hypothetical protein